MNLFRPITIQLIMKETMFFFHHYKIINLKMEIFSKSGGGGGGGGFFQIMYVRFLNIKLGN